LKTIYQKRRLGTIKKDYGRFAVFASLQFYLPIDHSAVHWIIKSNLELVLSLYGNWPFDWKDNVDPTGVLQWWGIGKIDSGRQFGFEPTS
jgi:hypothetical protein